MIRRAILGLLCALVFVVPSHGQDYEQLKKVRDQETRRAVRAYERAIREAEETMEARLMEAKDRFLTDLAAAQRRATQADDLDSAILIREARESLDQGEIQIIAAFYGQNVSWLDVTDKVQAASKGETKWTATVSTKDWGQPAPDFAGPRTLLIRYSVDGQEQFKAAYEGREISIP